MFYISKVKISSKGKNNHFLYCDSIKELAKRIITIIIITILSSPLALTKTSV